jgi:hypothetical protein
VRSQAEPGNEFGIALFRWLPSRYKHPVDNFLIGTGALMADKSRPADSFFWPATLLLISVAVSLICWGIYNMLPQTARAGETPLRIAQFPPKFNHTSKEVSAVKKPEVLPEPRRVVVAFASAEPPLFTLPMEEAPSPLPGLPPPPLLPPLPPMDFQPTTLMIPEPAQHSVQPPETKMLVYLESTSGDTPMLRNWKTLALYSLLTSTVYVQVPAPARAQETEGKASQVTLDSLEKTIKDSVAAVNKSIKEIKDELEAQNKALKKEQENNLAGGLALNKKIEDIEKSLKAIREEMDVMRKAGPQVAKTGIDKDSVEDIKKQLVAIEQAILKLLPSGPGRISLSSPVPPISTSGRVVLINSYQEPLLFIINKKPYRVLPGINQPIENVPSGTLSYEVWADNWGMRAQNTTSLAPNETFTLSAR